MRLTDRYLIRGWFGAIGFGETFGRIRITIGIALGGSVENSE